MIATWIKDKNTGHTWLYNARGDNLGYVADDGDRFTVFVGIERFLFLSRMTAGTFASAQQYLEARCGVKAIRWHEYDQHRAFSGVLDGDPCAHIFSVGNTHGWSASYKTTPESLWKAATRSFSRSFEAAAMACCITLNDARCEDPKPTVGTSTVDTPTVDTPTVDMPTVDMQHAQAYWRGLVAGEAVAAMDAPPAGRPCDFQDEYNNARRDAAAALLRMEAARRLGAKP